MDRIDIQNDMSIPDQCLELITLLQNILEVANWMPNSQGNRRN